jgi:hypothetical protein
VGRIAAPITEFTKREEREANEVMKIIENEIPWGLGDCLDRWLVIFLLRSV